jgi:nucleotide-binding universal stress UspA family protein
MKILIGIDASSHARSTVEFVRKLAWPAGTRIAILSVAETPVLAYSEVYVPSISGEVIETLVRDHERAACDAERELKAAGFVTEAKVAQGDPRFELIAAARAERADLVIVGSHGRTGLSRLVMGSVAHHVVTHAPCSVLVVKTGPQ